MCIVTCECSWGPQQLDFPFEYTKGSSLFPYSDLLRFLVGSVGYKAES